MHQSSYLEPAAYLSSLSSRDLIPVKAKKLSQPLSLAIAMTSTTLISVDSLAWSMYLHGALNLVFVTDSMPTAMVLTTIMFIVRIQVPTEYGFNPRVGTHFFVMMTVAPTDYCASY